MKKGILLFTCCLLLAACVFGGSMAFRRSFSLHLCQDLTLVGEDRICGIDYDVQRQIYRIYQTDSDGTQTDAITLSAEKDERRYVYDRLIYDARREQIYVHVSEYGCTNGLIEREEIFRCDFSSGKLKKAWEIPVEENNPYPLAEAVCAEDGNLYYLCSDAAGLCVRKSTSRNTFTEIRRIASDNTLSISEYAFYGSNTVAAFSTVGGLYVEQDGALQVTAETAATDSSSYVNLAWGSTVTEYTDWRAEEVVCYFPESETWEKIRCSLQYDNAEIADEAQTFCSVEADMLSNLCMRNQTDFVAYSEIPEAMEKTDAVSESCLAVYQDGTMKLYRNLYYSSRVLWKNAALWSAVTFAIALPTGSLCIGIVYMLRKRRYISIRVEVILFAVVLFGTAVSVTGYEINRMMTDSFNENYRKVFDDLETEMDGELDALYQNTGEDFFSDAFYDGLCEIMENTLISNVNSGEQEFAPYFVFHAENAEGELMMLYNSSGKIRIPTAYVYRNQYISSNYQTVLQQKETMNFTQYDTEGTWNIKLCYYESPDHSQKGIIEIGIDQYLTDYKTKQISSQIVLMILILCSAFLMIIIFCIGFSFRPIRRLGVQVEKGTVEKPKILRGSIEISRVWEQLYVMIQNVRGRQEEIRINNTQHYRYVSDGLVRLLQAEGLDQVVPGLSRRRLCTVAVIAYTAETLQAQRSFLEKLLDWTDANQGTVLDLRREKAEILFSPDFSRQHTDFPMQLRQWGTQCHVQVGLGIATGQMLISVIGAETCAKVTVFSPKYTAAQEAAAKALAEKALGFFAADETHTESAAGFTASNGIICGRITEEHRNTAREGAKIL